MFVLIDSESGFKEVDKLLLDILEKRERPFVIVFTKIDKIKEGN